MNTIPRTSGIYQIRHIESGKVYIGSAVNLYKRKQDHWSYLRARTHHNAYLQHAWNKHGEQAFEFSVIELVLSSFVLEREQYWLDKTRAYDRKRGFNFSPTAGSPLGVKRSAATLEKMRIASTGRVHSAETRQKMRIASAAWKRSPEVGKKIAAAKTGFRYTEESRQKMSEAQRRRTDVAKRFIVTDPNGNEILVTNLQRFCEEHGLTRSGMHMTMTGRIKQHKGGWTCRLA